MTQELSAQWKCEGNTWWRWHMWNSSI